MAQIRALGVDFGRTGGQASEMLSCSPVSFVCFDRLLRLPLSMGMTEPARPQFHEGAAPKDLPSPPNRPYMRAEPSKEQTDVRIHDEVT